MTNSEYRARLSAAEVRSLRRRVRWLEEQNQIAEAKIACLRALLTEANQHNRDLTTLLSDMSSGRKAKAA